MSTKLVIGCRDCENKLKETKGFSFGPAGDIKLSFPVQTEFNRHELNELYSNQYNCVFCTNRLEITPRMLRFILHFFDKMFHIEVSNGFIEISNGELSFAVPINKEIHSVTDFLAQSGVLLENAEDYLPNESDIKLIQDGVKEYDCQQWLLRIESGNALGPCISNHGLWFNDLF